MLEVEYGVVLASSQNAKSRQAIKAMTGPTLSQLFSVLLNATSMASAKSRR